MTEEGASPGADVFCRACGNKIHPRAEICPNCGVRQELKEQEVNPNQSAKSRLIAFILCTFLGFFGAHRFYAGKITSAILQLLFGWVTLYIWVLVDWISILSGTFKDIDEKIISSWSVDV